MPAAGVVDNAAAAVADNIHVVAVVARRRILAVAEVAANSHRQAVDHTAEHDTLQAVAASAAMLQTIWRSLLACGESDPLEKTSYSFQHCS